jgi:hypothetical protein
MTVLKTPNALATSRQLWRLHQLTGEDTRDLQLTMQEASDRISELVDENVGDYKQADFGSVWYEKPLAWLEFLKSPMTYADIRLFFGDPGSGKSMTTIACVIDDVYKYITYVVSSTGEFIKVHALNEVEQDYLETPINEGGMGIQYNNLRHVRIFNEDGTKSKIIDLYQKENFPKRDFSVLSPVKIFSNRTFYGVKFVPFDLENFIQYINDPVFANGWVVLSEAVLLGKDNPQSYVAQFLRVFGATCRIRHLHMTVDMQYRNMLAPTFHLLATTNVECSYREEIARNGQTLGMVNLSVNNSSPIMSSTEYISNDYRRFYDTDELMKVPQYRIDRAMGIVRGEVK